MFLELLETKVHFRRRSPLVLTLRLPENVVGKKIDPYNIREGLRRVIRKASHHKIAKREVVEDEDLKDLINVAFKPYISNCRLDRKHSRTQRKS